MSSLDLDLVRHALQTACAHGFAEVELAAGEDRFTARLGAVPRGVKSPTPAEESQDPAPRAVVSTLVGYYQPAKNPLEVGRQVALGDIVAVIQALGISNDVESKVSGEVVEVLVEPNQPVEYGQPLALLRPI